MTLREVLHAHIPTLDRQSSVRDAVDKMDVYQFPALVIVDENLLPLGVLTEGDLCRAIGGQESLFAVRDQPALQFATTKPTIAPPGQEISDALHLMLSQGITLLPVVDEGTLSGVVLRVDLMHAMLMDSEPGA